MTSLQASTLRVRRVTVLAEVGTAPPRASQNRAACPDASLVRSALFWLTGHPGPKMGMPGPAPGRYLGVGVPQLAPTGHEPATGGGSLIPGQAPSRELEKTQRSAVRECSLSYPESNDGSPASRFDGAQWLAVGGAVIVLASVATLPFPRSGTLPPSSSGEAEDSYSTVIGPLDILRSLTNQQQQRDGLLS